MMLYWASHSQAQMSLNSQDMNFYNTSNGLAQNHVFNIEEDEEGFMWFCTMGGLSRFDGFSFVNYSYDKDDSTSMSNNFVTSLLIDSKNRFWVTTRKGLNLFNPKTGKCHRFLHQENISNSPAHNVMDGIIEDANGLIWFAHEKGVDSYDPEANVFQHYLHPEFDIMRHVGDLAIDQNQSIWVASNTGLFRVNKKNNTLEHFPLPQTPNSRYAKIFNVRVNDENEIWISGKRGLARFDQEEEKYYFEDIKMETSGIFDFIEYEKGLFYLATIHQGFMVWDVDQQQILVNRPYAADDPYGILSNSVYSVFADSRKNVWLGLFNGLNRFFPHEPRYANYKFEKGKNSLGNTTLFVTEDNHRTTWTNTMQGLQRRSLDQSSFSIVNMSNDFEELYMPIDAIASTKDGVFMQLLNMGFFKYEEEKNEITPIQNILSHERISLFSDIVHTSYLYVASKDGICHYQPIESDTTWIHPMDLSSSLTNNNVDVIDQWDDRIVFVCSGHLCVYQLKTEALSLYQHDEISEKGAVKNLVSTDDYIYVGVTDGILQFDKNTNAWRSFGDEHGIVYYSTFHVDFDENLWLAAGDKLLNINTKTEEFYSYDAAQGFITRRAQRTADGHILFSTSNGLMEIDPQAFFRDTTRPKVVFKGIDVYNEPLPLAFQSNHVDNIKLSYEQRFITLHFAALHFIFEDQINYRYRLVGLDDTWRSSGNQREVTFTDLDHGKYSFEIQAITEDKISSDVLRIQLEVETPFHKSAFFYCLIGLVGVGIIYGLYRIRRRILISNKEKELAEKNAEYKSMFLAHMSHEIRTPLNAIMGLNQLLLDSVLSAKNKKYAESIAISCDNLLMIVNDILDQSKIEHGVYTIENKEFNLRDLLVQLDILFTIQAEKKNLNLHIHKDKQVPHDLIGDPVRLFQILTNLIGNAIKFTNKGQVNVKVTTTNSNTDSSVMLCFVIQDSGIGIPADQLNMIFDSFGQVNEIESVGNQGSGLGLSIVSDLVSKMKGDISVESVHGKGATFVVTLPFGKGSHTPVPTHKKALMKSDKPLIILLAEDTMLNQILVTDVIAKYFPKAHLDVVENGQLAIEAVCDKKYDIVLMDVKMPIMNGIIATKEIRALHGIEASTRIVGLTANAIPQQIEECLQAGMNDVITKPIILEEFISTLSNLSHHGNV